jgi:hypothetical protein
VCLCILLDPDFIDTTKLLLAEISSARSQPIFSVPFPSHHLSDPSSDFPSDFPSDPPTDLASDPPTDLASDPPSVPSFDLPSDLPTDLASDPPSDPQSDLPSIPPSDLPTDLPTDLPSPPVPPQSTDLTQSNDSNPQQYPFNLVITSATVPSSLSKYLDDNHPNMTRLLSPGIHKLPKELRIEYVRWSDGSRWADIERYIRKIWAEDMTKSGKKSKVLIFCNKGTTVVTLGEYLESKFMANVALTSDSESRMVGSNRHLDGFLKPLPARPTVESSPSSTPTLESSPSSSPTLESAPKPAWNAPRPHVLITTSLLSRGLDFAPSVRHVLLLEPPRNMIDFLHRAGRTGRAGEWGRVVVFEKKKGRGSLVGRQVKKKISELESKGQRHALDDETEWDETLPWHSAGGGSERGQAFALGRNGARLRTEMSEEMARE